MIKTNIDSSQWNYVRHIYFVSRLCSSHQGCTILDLLLTRYNRCHSFSQLLCTILYPTSGFDLISLTFKLSQIIFLNLCYLNFPHNYHKYCIKMTNSTSYFPLCASSLIENFDKNTTFVEALTPCLSFILFPLLQFCSSLPCFLFLIIYGYLTEYPKLALTKVLAIKFFLNCTVIISSIIHVFIVYFNLNENGEIVVGNFLDLSSVVLLLLSDFWRWRKGILSSIWIHFAWTTRLCFSACQMIFIEYNTVSFLKSSS